MTKQLNRLFAIIFLLFGVYLGCWRGDYSRANYYTSLACFAAIAAETKEGGAE